MDILYYEQKARSIDYRFSTISGPIQYVGPLYLVITKSSVYFEYNYLKPLLDKAKDLEAVPNPAVFKRGNNKWTREIVADGIAIYMGTNLYNLICERHKVRNGIRIPPQGRPMTFLKIEDAYYALEDVKNFSQYSTYDGQHWRLELKSGVTKHYPGNVKHTIVSK